MIPTKTLMPKRRSHLLRRSRLVDMVYRHVERAMTLVSAPAGYGKTSLLVDFGHDAAFSVCWLALDESEQDLHTFVNYLVAAIQHRFPDFGAPTLRTLTSNPEIHKQPSALAGVIVQDIMDHIHEFFVLVLDDYHTVESNAEINALTEALLKYRPEYWHLIIASRTVPRELPIILLTARSQIAYVGQADLAFTADEVQALMAQMHDIHLTQEQAAEIVTSSEGWITGILLSTTGMWQGMRDLLAQAVQRQTHGADSQQGPIYTYLAEQVFQGQPPALCDFMLVSSTLPEMNAYLCRETLRLDHAAQTLHALEQRGVFLTTVVDHDSGTWYRYHHLFHDFLQTRLRTQDPARFRGLHRQVADWFETNQEWENAVRHRLNVLKASTDEGQDMRVVAQTMDAGVRATFYAKRMETLVAWYEALPAALRPDFPRLQLFAGRALVNLGRPDEALPILRQGEENFAQRGQTEGMLFAAIERAGIWHARGRFADTLALVHELLPATADYSAPAAEAHRLAGLACLNLGQPQKAVEHLETSLQRYINLGWTNETAMTYLDLSLALLRIGHLCEGWSCQDKAIELYRQAGPSGRLAIALNNVACERYYLAGDYAQALDYLTEALEVAQTAGHPRAQVLALLSTADLYSDLGAVEQAMSLYTKAEQLARRLGDANLVNFAQTGIAQARLRAGDALSALSLAMQARDQAQRRQDVYQQGLCALTLGAAHLEVGDSGSALTELERGRDLLLQSDARRDLTRAYVLLARAHQAANAPARALEALGQALDIGVETQTFHHLILEGQRIFDLFKQQLEQNPSDRRPGVIMDRIRALPDVVRKTIGGLAPTALPHPPALRFYGFGPGRVDKEKDPIPVSVWRSALARHLTFYLLVFPPRSRDQITETFWPDVSRDKAGSTFHWAKHQIQHALGRALVSYEEGLYRIELDPDCWFDVSAFESLLKGQDGRQARLEQAVKLYQGDFLEGYDGEWCISIRKRLQFRFRDALLELGELYLAQDQFGHAFATLSQAIDVDDLHEPAVRALARLHALDGRRPAALDLLERLMRQLQEKLDTPPSPETQALYQAIQKGADVASLKT